MLGLHLTLTGSAGPVGSKTGKQADSDGRRGMRVVRKDRPGRSGSHYITHRLQYIRTNHGMALAAAWIGNFSQVGSVLTKQP